MSTERQLLDDLDRLGDRLVDVEFSSDLYRALANNRWTAPEGHTVALSWSRAEEVVNELRARRGEAPLELAQTGGEGEVSQAVLDEAGRLGWRLEALDTKTEDPAHAGKPVESPPPRGTGEAHSPADDARGWERVGHAEADEARRGR